MATAHTAPGLHVEVAKAMFAKRNPELEEKVLKWIGEIIGEKVPKYQGTPYEEALADGVFLCKLMEKLNPGSVRNIDLEPKHAFKMVENVAKFLRAAQKFGVPEDDLFQTVDLVEKKNVPQVTATIVAVARACWLHPEFKGPYLTGKPAEPQPRHFDEKQLKESAALGSLAL